MVLESTEKINKTAKKAQFKQTVRQVSKKTLNLRGKILSLEEPLVMGILNLTPDSFFADSRVSPENAETLLARAEAMLTAGADILDVGGYSTRPGATAIAPEAELARVIPAVAALRQAFPDAALSVDTFRAAVAEAAVKAGADLINDVSGGNLDADMFATVARLKVPYVLMHMRGTPETMQQFTHYDYLISDVLRELQQKVYMLNSMGVADLIVDPGFGFAKTPEQNFSLIAGLSAFAEMGYPLLVGVSRKSTITKTLHVATSEALNGTTVLHTAALLNGANMLRVHDVKEAREAIVLVRHLQNTKL